jgi:hypothetical protein
MNHIFIVTTLVATLLNTSCSMNNTDNLDEFTLNYSGTGLANREKEVLLIAKKAAIDKFGSKKWHEEKPYSAELDQDVWFISGTLYSELNGKRIRSGEPNDEGKPILLIGGTIEIEISNQSLKVLNIIHTK